MCVTVSVGGRVTKLLEMNVFLYGDTVLCNWKAGLFWMAGLPWKARFCWEDRTSLEERIPGGQDFTGGEGPLRTGLHQLYFL